jgi:hypothetical protein
MRDFVRASTVHFYFSYGSGYVSLHIVETRRPFEIFENKQKHFQSTVEYLLRIQ